MIADNRRCLQLHTDQQQQLIERGGEGRTRVFSNGAYRLRSGFFGSPAAGRIARNILTVPHND